MALSRVLLEVKVLNVKQTQTTFKIVYKTILTLSRTSDTCSDPDQVEVFIKRGQSKMAFLSLCFYITSQFQIKLNAS